MSRHNQLLRPEKVPAQRSPSSTAELDDANENENDDVVSNTLSPRLKLPNSTHQLKGSASKVSDATWKLFRFMQDRETDDALPGGIVRGVSLESSSLAGLLLVLGGRTRSTREHSAGVAGRGTFVVVPNVETMRAWVARARDDLDPPLKRVFQLSLEMKLEEVQDFFEWMEVFNLVDEEIVRTQHDPLGTPLVLCTFDLFRRGIFRLHRRRSILHRILKEALSVAGRIIFDDVRLPDRHMSEDLLHAPWRKFCQERPAHASTSIFFLCRNRNVPSASLDWAYSKEMLKVIAPFKLDAAFKRDRDDYLLELEEEEENAGTGRASPRLRAMQATITETA